MVPFVFHTREAKSWMAHQRAVVLDSLLEGAAQQTLLFPLLISASHSRHATTTTQAKIPNDGLLRPPRKKEPWVDTHTHIFAPTLVKKFGFSAGKAPLTVHQSEGDTGEVRARQIQGIIGPLSSLQLSLTRLVGENEGDRREFMTYPCNHRGALSQLDIKHMGRWKKYEKRKEKLRKVGKSVELSALSPNIWL